MGQANPMEYLWNSYGATRQQHASSGLNVPGRDGGGNRTGPLRVQPIRRQTGGSFAARECNRRFNLANALPR